MDCFGKVIYSKLYSELGFVCRIVLQIYEICKYGKYVGMMEHKK